MNDDSQRPPRGRKRPRFGGQKSQLGGMLVDLRTARGFTLRQVEEATDYAVSNAYLSQLEKGKVQKPSPDVLHSLAAAYAVPYESLMEKAGYLPPSSRDPGKRRGGLAAFVIDDLTTGEEEELLEYLAFIRSRKPSR
jgi:transcriptional regulator with XRE-family HTH domain